MSEMHWADQDVDRDAFAAAGIPLADDVDQAEVEAEVAAIIAASRRAGRDDWEEVGVIDVEPQPDGSYARPADPDTPGTG